MNAILFDGPVVELLFDGFIVVAGSGVSTNCVNDPKVDFFNSSVEPYSSGSVIVSAAVSSGAEVYVVIGFLLGGPGVELARGLNVVRGCDVKVRVVNISVGKSSILGVDFSSKKLNS